MKKFYYAVMLVVTTLVADLLLHGFKFTYWYGAKAEGARIKYLRKLEEEDRHE